MGGYLPEGMTFEAAPTFKPKANFEANLTYKSLNSGYFQLMHDTVADYLEHSKALLEPLDFDTFVVTGISGAVAGGVFASYYGAHLLVVRKQIESSHAYYDSEGTIGRKWVFLDDFVSSGSTFNKCLEVVHNLSKGILCKQRDDEKNRPWLSSFVGIYEYTREILTGKEGFPAARYTGELIDWSKIV